MVAGVKIEDVQKDGQMMENIMNVMNNFDPNKEIT